MSATEPRSAEEGISYLKRLERTTTDPQYRQMINDRDAVLRQYGRVFGPENIPRLGEHEFKEFLLYENNRHWWGIHRQQAQIVANMPALRSGLEVLVDESEPIEKRLDYLEPRSGTKPIKGLGKAVMTPILHVVYPDKYGVWNSIAESAMRRLGFWPEFDRGSGFGSKYVSMNTSILNVASELEVDLWTLDTLWWMTEKEHEPTKHQFEGGEGSAERLGSTGQSARARHTFMCERCFQLKATHLRSEDSTVCSDCAGS